MVGSMVRSAPPVAVAGLSLDPGRSVALSTQLYEGLRRSILSGRFRPGTRLPSTRSLAKDYEISRNTVLLAYERLVAEGYFESKAGSGTRVVRSLPDESLSVEPANATLRYTPVPRRISARGKLLSAKLLTTSQLPQPFQLGLPDISAFPFKTWSRLLARHLRRPGCELLGYGDPAGYRPLREAIATYIRTARAVQCESDQVIVVNGSQQGLDLVARLLVDSGEKALVEDPGYPGVRIALQAAGAKLCRLPIDTEGANIFSVTGRTGDCDWLL